MARELNAIANAIESEFRPFKGGDRGRQLCGLELLKPIQGVKNERRGGKKFGVFFVCFTDIRKTEMAYFSAVKLASEKQARGRVRIWKGEE